MLPLGTPLPAFRLRNIDDKWVSSENFKASKGLLVMFICNHCPFVKHIRDGLVALGRDYTNSEIDIVAINSNDTESFPEDDFGHMKLEAQSAGYAFPYLLDDTQKVAKAFDAACTPDFFLFDAQLKLVYRGQFDESRPGNGISVTGKHLREALESLRHGRSLPTEQRPSLGCNIKWRQ